MEQDAIADKIQGFIAMCRAHRLKVTPQRVAIYRHLLSGPDHPTADTVYRRVREEHPNISFDTVNRTLLTFADVGILDAIEIFGGGKRFDLDVTVHQHFHCIGCGKIFDFYSDDRGGPEIPETVRHQFHVISRRVVFKGYCGACNPLTINKTERRQQ